MSGCTPHWQSGAKAQEKTARQSTCGRDHRVALKSGMSCAGANITTNNHAENQKHLTTAHKKCQVTFLSNLHYVSLLTRIDLMVKLVQVSHAVCCLWMCCLMMVLTCPYLVRAWFSVLLPFTHHARLATMVAYDVLVPSWLCASDINGNCRKPIIMPERMGGQATE